MPDTSHLITITALLPNHTSESSSNYSANVEFRTLPSKQLAIPTDLVLEKNRNEQDSYVLSWQPAIQVPNTSSDGIQVGGYSIYLDGIRVHQILNPYGKFFFRILIFLFKSIEISIIKTFYLKHQM